MGKYLRARGCHFVTIAPANSKPHTAAMLFIAGPAIEEDALCLNMYSKYFGRKVANPITAIRMNIVAKTCSTYILFRIKRFPMAEVSFKNSVKLCTSFKFSCLTSAELFSFPGTGNSPGNNVINGAMNSRNTPTMTQPFHHAPIHKGLSSLKPELNKRSCITLNAMVINILYNSLFNND